MDDRPCPEMSKGTFVRAHRWSENKRTPEWLPTVEALVRLGEHATPAFAEATATHRLLRYAQKWGLKRSRGTPCVQRLLARRCSEDCEDHRPPGADHVSFWLRDGKPYSYVFQPYGIGPEQFRDLAAFAERVGLDVSIEALASWHYPGDTVLVELTPRGSV